MKMCGAKRDMISSYKAPDKLLPDGRIERGVETELWATCGKRLGHHGEHGPWSKWGRLMWKMGLFR